MIKCNDRLYSSSIVFRHMVVLFKRASAATWLAFCCWGWIGARWLVFCLGHPTTGARMMHRLLVLIVAMVVSLQASTIVSHLELVLSDSGTLIDGPTDVTISLIGSTGDVRWREFHSEVPFFKGVASIQIGYLKEIKTHYFFGEGVQLMVSIGSDSIHPCIQRHLACFLILPML